MKRKSRNANPWRHDSELAMIRDWFYPQHIPFDPYSPPATLKDMRHAAVRKVQSWKVSNARVPHACLATAAMVDAQLHFEHYMAARSEDGFDLDGEPVLSNQRRSQSEGGFLLSRTAMQSIYAMAFCRFVNGFVDRDVVKKKTANSRSATTTTNTATASDDSDSDDVSAGNNGPRIPRGAGESSMYAHAVTIGMPTSFVDLRHRATHGVEMPELEELTKMNDQALNWLWVHWWKVNAKGDPGRALWELEEFEKKIDEIRRARERQQLQEKEGDVGGIVALTSPERKQEDNGEVVEVA